METYFAYFDETGDDGDNTISSDVFILTNIYMPGSEWKNNYSIMKSAREKLNETFGFYTSQEMHTKDFIKNKRPFSDYKWTRKQRIDILNCIVDTICNMKLKSINIIVDKTRFVTPGYKVLEKALTYSIQRIENDCDNKWNYMIISDEGRLTPMRKTARKIRMYNPLPPENNNKPIRNLIEDVMEKDSKESYFIQICDFISFFVYLFYKKEYLKKHFSKRISRLVDEEYVDHIMDTLKNNDVFNLNANSESTYGFVIVPK